MTRPSHPQPDHGARERWRIFGPAIILTLAGFVVAYQFVEPAPPRRIAIATGGTEGVGRAATRAVVTTSIFILATDYFLTQVLIALLIE